MGCSAESGAGKADSPAVSASATPAGGVIPGVEVLLSDSLHLIRGKRVEALLPILAQEAAQFREQSSRYWIYQ